MLVWCCMFCIHLSYTTGLFRFEETFNFSDFQSANWNEDEFYRFGWTKWIQSRRSFRFEIFQAFPVLDSFVRPKLKFRSGVTCLRAFSFQWKVFPSKVVFWRPREKVSRAAFQWIKRNSLIKSQITPPPPILTDDSCYLRVLSRNNQLKYEPSNLD